MCIQFFFIGVLVLCYIEVLIMVIGVSFFIQEYMLSYSDE